MTVHVFMYALSVSSALLAVWIIARFPALTPTSARGVSAGLAGAILSVVLTPPAVMLVGGVAGAIPAAMLVALPSGICIFLAIAWIMLYVVRSIQPYGR